MMVHLFVVSPGNVNKNYYDQNGLILDLRSMNKNLPVIAHSVLQRKYCFLYYSSLKAYTTAFLI